MTFGGVAESKWQRSHMRGCALSRLYRVSAQSLGRKSTVRYTVLVFLVQTPPRLTVCPKRWYLCTALQRSQITEAIRARCTSKYAVFHKAVSALRREDAVVHTPSRVHDPSYHRCTAEIKRQPPSRLTRGDRKLEGSPSLLELRYGRPHDIAGPRARRYIL